MYKYIYKYDMKIDEELFWNRRENNEEVVEVKIGIWIEANYIPCLDEILIMKPTILPNENIPIFFEFKKSKQLWHGALETQLFKSGHLEKIGVVDN